MSDQKSASPTLTLSLDEVSYLRLLLKAQVATELLNTFRTIHASRGEEAFVGPMVDTVQMFDTFYKLDSPLSVLETSMDYGQVPSVDVPLNKTLFGLLNVAVNNRTHNELLEKGPRPGDPMDREFYALATTFLPGLKAKFAALEVQFNGVEQAEATKPLSGLFTQAPSTSLN